MNDSENQRYCSIHSCALDNERFCQKCNYKHSYYFENRLLQNRNETAGTFLHKRPYIKENNLCFFCVCHNCKYFMFHSLLYCPKCSNPMITEKISYKEFCEKHTDYIQGY